MIAAAAYEVGRVTVFHQVTSSAPQRTEESVDALRRLLAAH